MTTELNSTLPLVEHLEDVHVNGVDYPDVLKYFYDNYVVVLVDKSDGDEPPFTIGTARELMDVYAASRQDGV